MFIGVQNWLDQRAAMAVVNDFLTAVEEGDRDSALFCLEAGRREELEPDALDAQSPLWLPTPGCRHRINEIHIDGDNASAKVWIEKDGFILEPVVHLQRVSTGSWKIVRIDDLEVDPKWKDILRKRAQEADAETNRELQEALRGQPGTKVSRAPLPGTDQE